MPPFLILALIGGGIFAAYKLGSKSSSPAAKQMPYLPQSNPNASPNYSQVSTTDHLSEPMAVLELQKSLNDLGIQPHLTEDGAMGPHTSDAVKAFQTKMGLEVDGIPGPHTWRAIRLAVLAAHGQAA